MQYEPERLGIFILSLGVAWPVVEKEDHFVVGAGGRSGGLDHMGV